MASTVFRTARRVALASTAIGATGVTYRAKTDEGFGRSIYFWGKATPIYAHYRATQFYVETMGHTDAEQDAAYERLHDRYADQVFDIIRSLKGFYIKIAQVGSTRADFLPSQYLHQAAELQDNAPSRSIDEIRAIISESYGRPCDEIFASIDPKPLGVASIGQVHRAVLKDGRVVAVKVQHRDSEQLFRWDMATMQDFARTLQPAHLPYLKELEKQFLTEFDYRGEARNLAIIRRNLMKSPYAAKVVVPEPYEELCTREVLVMEFLQGKKLIEGIKDHFEAIAEAKGMTVDQLKMQMEQQDKEREARGLDFENGPDATTMRYYLATLAAKQAMQQLGRGLYDYTLGWVVPRATNDDKDRSDRPKHQLLNIPEILQLVIDVHGHEIFVDGAFNGDPHPGNIMLLRDGRLGLIDYGQVKHLTADQRRRLAKLALALHEGTKDDVVRVMTQDIGMKTKRMNPYVLEKQARILFDRDDRTVTEGMNFQLFTEHLDKLDPVESLPDHYILAFRASILLRGLSYWLRYRFSHAESWAGVAHQVLNETEPTTTTTTTHA